MLPERFTLFCVNPDPSTSRLLESVAEAWGFYLYNLNGRLLEQGMGRGSSPSVILVDTTNTNGEMPGLIERLKERWYACPIVSLIDGTIGSPAEFCLRSGLYDYVTKPLDADRLRMTLRHACDHARLTTAMRTTTTQVGEKNTSTTTRNSLTSRGGIPRFDEMERDLIVQAIRVCRGNVPEIARRTGISEATIYRKIRKYDLAPLLRGSRNAEAATAARTICTPMTATT